MDLWAQERRALEIDLRSALKNDELKLFFQPLIGAQGARDHRLRGPAALAAPAPGPGGPRRLHQNAPSSGALICKIGEWVLNEACRQAASWPPALKVAVNLSPNQFASRRPGRPDRAGPWTTRAWAPSAAGAGDHRGALLRDTAGNAGPVAGR